MSGTKKKSQRTIIACFIFLIIILIFTFTMASCSEPEEMGEMTWPTSGIATTLPVPSWAETDDDGTITLKGDLSTDSEDYFCCDLGVDSEDSFTDYVEDCKAAGYTVDYESSDGYYSANDEAGNHLYLDYTGEDSSRYDCAYILVEVESAEYIAEAEAEAETDEDSEAEEEVADAAEDAAASTEEAAEAAEADSSSISAAGYASYEEIYDDYSQRIIDATPGLIEEFNTEAAEHSGDIDALAELCNDKIGELAEIEVEGTETMAAFMYANYSDDAYDEYESWAGELYEVYEEYAGQITDAYLNAAV